MLDVRRLVLLRELAVRGTLAAVAEALNFSPSAVSQQLSLLEQEAGVPLLRALGAARRPHRAGGGARRGRRRGARRARARGGRGGLQARGPVTGRVRLAVFQSAALALMPATLRRWRREHPGVRVEVVQREPEEALRETWARDFDMVLAEQYPAHAAPPLPGLLRTELVRDRAPPRAAARRRRRAPPPPRRAHRRGRRPVGDGAAGTASRHFAEQPCRTRGFEPDVRYETSDLQAHIRLVESGNAVALLPDLVWAGRSTTCRLVDLPGRPERTVFVAQRRVGVGQPATAVVLRALHRQVAVDDGP